MSPEEMRVLFEYNAWANHRSLDAASALSAEQFTQALGSSFSSVRDTLAQVWPGEDAWTEFTYVWRSADLSLEGRKWYVGDPNEGSQTLIDLGDALLGKKIITPKVKMFGGAIIGKHLPHDPKDPD